MPRQLLRLRPAHVRVDGVALMLWLGAAVCGVMLGLGAAWPSAWPFCWLALAGMCVLVISASRRSSLQGLFAIALGWAAWQIAGTGWIVLGVREGDHTFAWQLAVLAFFGITHLLPLVPVWWLLDWATRGPDASHDRDPVRLGLRVGLTLACAETLRQFGWLGSGYASLGSAFVDMPGAKLALPLVGAAGWGWAVWCSAALLAFVVWFQLAGARRASGVAAVGLMLCLAGWAALWQLEQQPRPRWMDLNDNAEVAALIVQPPAERGKRWTREARDEALDQLEAALRMASPGTVLVTAETYFPEPPPKVAEGAWLDLVKRVRALGVHVLVGMPHLLRDNEGVHLMNAVVQLSPDRQSLYAKERLVPGGEYLPWPELLQPLYEQMFEKARNGQRSGPPELQAPLFAGGQAIGTSICHELAFPLTMVERARGANWLVNLADDMWIDNTLYRQQMLTVARLRAMESGKPVLRVSQGSTSALIAPDGQVTAQAPDSAAHLLPIHLQARDGHTPYHRAALWLAWIPLALAGAWCLLAMFRRPSSNDPNSPP
jgi:apolipoprotein N-acyltransferase